MDRVERIREEVEKVLQRMSDAEDRRCAYSHLYGVSQACALLALKRNQNVELAIIAGMLHDIYTYANMDAMDHAHKGAKAARDIMDKLGDFDEKEKDIVCKAIYNHSDKELKQDWLDEILKDADVMQKVLYNPLYYTKQREPKRYSLLKKELGME